MDHLKIGDVIKLYPAPLPDVEAKPGAPLRLRRVQDGAGNYRRFVPDEGVERVLDYYFHDRLMRGDLLLVDPRLSYVLATAEGVFPAPEPEVTALTTTATTAMAAAPPASGSKRARPALDAIVDDRSRQEGHASSPT